MSAPTAPARFSLAVYRCVLPRPHVSTAEWAARHLQMPADSKLRGRFRLDLFPHVPEIFAACDDPEVETVSLQAAAQIGKTTISQAFLAKTAATNPHPMAFADADEHSTQRVIARTWRLFERCAVLLPLLPPRGRQSSKRMELQTCLIHGAWAGSAATAADYGAWVVVLNETDKMRQRSTDTEADFRYLMQERTKGYIGAKVLQISTPTLKGGSWIEAERLAGDNRRRLVPCPHCNHFQELRTGNGRTPGGVRFERLAGKLDPQKARETAWYECEKCRKRIEEHHRYEMLNSGLWVPEGCHVDKRGRMTGKALRAGPHASFGPLSTLHSLLPGITIGRYAQEWVAALTAHEHKRERIRNFVNSWEGNTWDPKPAAVTTSELADRMGCDEPLWICPTWARFVTLGADVGRSGETLLFYWAACCWGPHARGQLLDYGLAWGAEAFREVLRTRLYRHADGGPPLAPIQIGIDSGSFTESVYTLCASLPNCWPVKGSSRDPARPFVDGDFPEMYQGGFQRVGASARELEAKRRLQLYDLIIPNTKRSQGWLEERVTGLLKREAPNWFSLPRVAIDGQPVPGIDLPRHLLGDYEDDHGKWQKKYDGQDLRDAVRYAQVLAWHFTKNGRDWPHLSPRTAGAAAPGIVLYAGERRPDGRAWLD